MDLRTLKRNGGFLSCIMRQIPWDELVEHRRTRGRRWSLPTLMRWTLLGLLTGCKGTADVEELSERASSPLLKLCGLVKKRLPDTTLRTFLCKMDWKSARFVLRCVAHQGWQKKRFKVGFGFPYGVVSMDGKYSTLPTWDGPFAQRTEVEGHAPYGKLRCITSTLTSDHSRPCLDASPIPAQTNEVGHFKTAFDELCENFAGLFKMVTYDAGALSESNADHAVAKDKHYLFHIANENHHQYQLAEELLATVSPACTVEDGLGIKRTIRLFPVNRGRLPKNKTYVRHIFEHARTLIRIDSEYEKNGKQVQETRYFISSEKTEAMAAGVWLSLIVRHWGVETCHQHLDVAFKEDDNPWIKADSNGALAVQLLRRAAYTVLTMYKSCTLRNEDLKVMSWPRTLLWLRDTTIAFSKEAAQGIRVRRPMPVPIST